MRTEDIVERFIASIGGWKSNETPGAYRSKLRQLVRFIGRKDPRNIRPRDLEAFKLYLLGRLSPWSVKTILTAVKCFFKWCHWRRIIRPNPAANLKIPIPPPPDPKPIPTETFEALLTQATQTGPDWIRARNIAILYWLRDTGGRVSGLINAQISGLNLRRGAIETIEKSRRVILYLNVPARQALRAWLRMRDELHPESDQVFISAKTHAGLTCIGVRAMLNSLAAAAHVSGRHNPHAFRHAWARDFLLAGGELSKCSQLLHHSSIAITDLYYARWYDSELRAAHARYSPGAKLPPIEDK